MIAYLSGGMENAENEGVDWRKMMTEWLKINLGHDVIDPTLESRKVVKDNNAKDFRNWKKTDPIKFKEYFRLLIQQDIDAIIGKADYLIVLWDSSVLKGGGTHGEVTIAHWVNKPIYLVNRLPLEDISSWIFSCSSRTYDSVDHLKNDLLKIYRDK